MGDSAFQDDLFTGCRWLERVTGLGVRVRVRLEPLGAGGVRVLRYERRRPGERDFVRRPEEEGRVTSLAAVAPGEDYERLFGAAAPDEGRRAR